jgi:glycosyltransferase involved in cell wall biosynthesis
MRIALASLDYPPQSTEGVARQRQALAEALVRLGHDVHVVTLADAAGSTEENGVRVHRVARGQSVNVFVPDLPVLDRPFTDAQLLCEGVFSLAGRLPLDVVDVPLWLAQPLALVRRAPCPVVVWLQTTLLHLVEIQQRSPRDHEQVLADVDRYVMSMADGCIADSQSILSDVERLYGLQSLASRTSVVYPGLPDATCAGAQPGDRDVFEALVVGRLEQRKGTQLLLEAIPRLLEAVPGLRLTFVGRDNSASDGFLRANGLSYQQAFERKSPDLASRVRFEGYVDDAELAAHYRRADVLLHPALYESFGLIFLEAMRASLPTVAFGTGGALEVFARGEADGGVLCHPGNVEALIEAVASLARDPQRRARTAAGARQAFERAFTSERMARETVKAYETAIASRRATGTSRRMPRRVFQIMEALQDRDAVSRIARNNAPILAALGAERPILSLFAQENVRGETGRLCGARFNAGDSAIFHYWGFSRLERLIERFPGRKAIHYHNITPPSFFAPRTAHYEMTARGYAQLSRIADRFDLVIGDSNYNLAAYAQHTTVSKPMLCVYPIVDREGMRTLSWDAELEARIRGERDGPVWLFVGRFAPNKRQDQVMRAFDRYAAAAGGGRLLLVGDTTAVPAFVARLEALRDVLANGHRIDIVPSVPDEALRGYYRAADLFVCASEHEGFCVPLAEAMVFDVPTIALDRGAVGETLGPFGLLVANWDPDAVAALAARVLADAALRDAVIAAQRGRLQSFSLHAATERLGAAVAYLRDGVRSPLFVDVPPGSAGLPEGNREWCCSIS